MNFKMFALLLRIHIACQASQHTSNKINVIERREFRTQSTFIVLTFLILSLVSIRPQRVKNNINHYGWHFPHHQMLIKAESCR